jgi:Ca-activated chloride channel family protein
MIAVPVMTVVPLPVDPRGCGGLIGLLDGVERAFPLKAIKVRATWYGEACRTVVEQRFENPFDQPLEAVHLFPLPEDGAVTEVELTAGEIVVKALCKERAEAERTFEEARQAGHTAALVTAERDDVHTLRITRIPPKAAVTVRIVVVERIAWGEGRARWRFPTVIAPRYLPGREIGQQGPGSLPDTDHAPDASRLSPPIRLSGGTMLDLEVHLAGGARKVTSSLHAVQVVIDHGVRIAPVKAGNDRDFVLEVEALPGTGVGTRACTDGAFTLVVVDPPTIPQTALPRDAVFVIDISGSMGGIKLDAAKKALSAALHGLVPGDRFRLIAFDDRVEADSPDFVAYDDRSLARGDRWIAGLQARGGTEMLAPLREALGGGSAPEGRIRTVLFVTDGQAHNDAELCAAVANRRGTTRLFTLGIDTAVNGALLGRLARLGGGVCELATPNDDIELVISRMEARFGGPLAEDVKVDAPAARPESQVLFSGRPLAFFVEGAPERVVVTGRTAAGPMRLEVVPIRVDAGIGVLWARDRVAWLEDRLVTRPFEEEAIRPEIVRVATAHAIASRFTAFVAVEHTRRVDGTMVEVVQPVPVPHGWAADFAAPPPPPQAVASQPRPMSIAAPMAAAPMGKPGGHAYAGYAPPMPASSRATRAIDMDDVAPAKTASGAKKKGVLADMMDAVSAVFAGGVKAPEAEIPAAKEVENEVAVVGLASVGELVRQQGADGSFGGDVRLTVAAMLALVKLGNTRVAGDRRRTVLKAATWLTGRPEPVAKAALAILDAVEGGAAFSGPPVGLGDLADLGLAGALLR